MAISYNGWSGAVQPYIVEGASRNTPGWSSTLSGLKIQQYYPLLDLIPLLSGVQTLQIEFSTLHIMEALQTSDESAGKSAECWQKEITKALCTEMDLYSFLTLLTIWLTLFRLGSKSPPTTTVRPYPLPYFPNYSYLRGPKTH